MMRILVVPSRAPQVGAGWLYGPHLGIIFTRKVPDRPQPLTLEYPAFVFHCCSGRATACAVANQARRASSMRMSWITSKPVLLVIVLALVLLVWLLITRAPIYLPYHDANAPPPPEDDSYVFGFATLTNPIVRFVVVGRPVPAEPAALRGWERYRRNIRDAPDITLHGVRFRVTPEEMIRLDRYERTGRKYRRDKMVLEDGSTAWVYRLMGERGIEALAD